MNLEYPSSQESLLRVVRECHNVSGPLPIWLRDYAPGAIDVYVSGARVGTIISSVVARAVQEAGFPQGPTPFSVSVPNPPTKSIKILIDSWRNDTIRFPFLNSTWRNELFAVYGNDGNIILEVERAAVSLFGFRSYGCHMTAYVASLQEEKVFPSHIWVARRSSTKQTWPFMLDNTVGGGMCSGQTPGTCIAQECLEEAGAVECKPIPSGSISYISAYNNTHPTGGLNPETQFVFDLQVNMDEKLQKFSPNPSDKEVDSFELLPVSECMILLRDMQFKPNSGLVLIDFFIRHGIVTPENEPDFLEILELLHRPLHWDFPGPIFPAVQIH